MCPPGILWGQPVRCRVQLRESSLRPPCVFRFLHASCRCLAGSHFGAGCSPASPPCVPYVSYTCPSRILRGTIMVQGATPRILLVSSMRLTRVLNVSSRRLVGNYFGAGCSSANPPCVLHVSDTCAACVLQLIQVIRAHLIQAIRAHLIQAIRAHLI